METLIQELNNKMQFHLCKQKETVVNFTSNNHVNGVC